MAVKVPLRIVLHAGNVVVAESDDGALWQRVLAAITEQPETRIDIDVRAPDDASSADVPAPALPAGEPADDGATPAPVDDPVARFAADLGVSREAVVRACAPATEPPYLHLDRHAWEEMRRSTPPRGPGSVAKAALAAALLVVWFRSAHLGSPTMKMVHKVLRTLGIRDKNAVRVIHDAPWAQLRDGAIVLNLASASRAVALARAFCTQRWTGHRAG